MRGVNDLKHEKIDPALVQTYSIAELREFVSQNEAQEINAYHRKHLANPRDILDSPIPANFIFNNPEARHILPNNRSPYSPEVESTIISDPVIKMLKSAREKGHMASDIVPAVRTRRSILAVLFQIPGSNPRR